ncbi:Protein AUXIN SIGNALING F-BOX 2 [Capsicum baccatum]|uniref:Protein AUXIN SIGNALING F-BOX 2 n=1 Tax=Capsicum baccatum TaxID=33114 RepID=A0A2G2WT12_CAPBA|nr:Protein AUXIN SIGNALING F-BOX 2 [Capsicum baccatum]
MIRDERGIFEPNQCAIAYDFGGGPGVWVYCRQKINRGMPGRLGIVPLWSIKIFVAIRVDKRAKRREQDMFGPNRCAIANDFRLGSGFRRVVGQKFTKHARKVGDRPSVVLDYVEDSGLEEIANSCKELQELRVFPSDLFAPGPNLSLTEQGLVAV